MGLYDYPNSSGLQSDSVIFDKRNDRVSIVRSNGSYIGHRKAHFFRTPRVSVRPYGGGRVPSYTLRRVDNGDSSKVLKGHTRILCVGDSMCLRRERVCVLSLTVVGLYTTGEGIF